MLELSRAIIEDCERVYRLSNDPAVRSVSFQSGQIDWNTHQRWFRRQLEDPATLFYLGFEAGKSRSDDSFVGQVRFVVHAEFAEISISLTESHRGKGWGRPLIGQALSALRRDSVVTGILAQVKFDNEASIRFFESCGFARLPTPGEPSRLTFFYSLATETTMEKLPATFIIAELSANHGHRLETALETVRAAKRAGADAIKIQTYTADTITLDSDSEPFQIRHGTIWDGTTLHKLYEDAYTPWEWHEALRDEAKRLDLVFFSTPFDKTAVDFLETLKVPMYKIASFEINDTPLIEYAASKGKPMIISTGIADLAMIESAVAACRKVGNNDITLLKCTSSYPAPVEDANLRTIPNLRDTFGVKVGLSDHTVGSSVALAAVALGAQVIEKHFIVDRSVGGPDSSFSMEPAEFQSMVEGIRTVEKALGRVTYEVTPAVVSSRKFSRSLFVCKPIAKGAPFTEENVRSVRPNAGLEPKNLSVILGRRARRDLPYATPLTWDVIE